MQSRITTVVTSVSVLTVISSSQASSWIGSSRSSSSNGVVDYILQGIGGGSTESSLLPALSTTTTSTLSGLLSVLSSSSPPAGSGGGASPPPNTALASIVPTVTRVSNASLSVVGAFNISLSNNSGLASASSCESEWHAYRNSSYRYIASRPAITTKVTSLVAVSWYLYTSNYTGPIITLCDGHPRAVGPRTTYVTETSYYTRTDVDKITIYPNYTEPTPQCNIARSDCDDLKRAWSSAVSKTPNY